MTGKITAYLEDKLGAEFASFKVRGATVYREESAIAVECVFERVLTADEKAAVEGGLKTLLPACFIRIEASYKKSYVDQEILAQEILGYFEASFAAVRSKMKREDLDIDIGEVVAVAISFDEHTYEYVEKSRLLQGLAGYLNSRYCNEFLVSGKVHESGVSTEEVKREILDKRRRLEEEAVTRPMHFIEVDNRTEFIGKLVEGNARYISDMEDPAENVVLAGKVKRVVCKTVSSGKTMFKFVLEDFTGEMPCTYFPAVNNIERMTDEFVEGSAVICRGTLKLDNFTRGLVFMPRAITMCSLPENFVKPEMVSKKVPAEYVAVHPERLEVGEQVLLFADQNAVRPAKAVRNKRFVVFDLETTGLDERTCRITEIGAISIENGEIAESFSTLVNPECFIPEEITKLTGIDEEMVKDAPTIAQVLPDFFKFCDGAVLVAHNIEFDYKFLDKNAREQQYIFANEQMDTLALARENIKGLSNYKLNTLCDHLGVELKGHHRAINDVLATAYIFLKLMKMAESS